jgi:LysM repeat protein
LLRASTEEIPATAVAQNLPTLTPTPTETPIEPTPEPQITTVVITTTPDESLLAAQETADAFATFDAQTTAVAQFETPIPLDPLVIQITETVAASTQVWVDMTLTAQFQFVLPSLTPTPEFFEAQPTPTTQIVQPVGSDCVHVVSAGENLFRIGLRYGVGYQTIANYNGIANPALISIGQQIQIPNCGQGVSSDGFGGVSSDAGIGGTPIGVGGVCGDVYIVEQYETLFGISMKCNVLIRDIIAMNPDKITDPDRIYYRQQLRLR